VPELLASGVLEAVVSVGVEQSLVESRFVAVRLAALDVLRAALLRFGSGASHPCFSASVLLRLCVCVYVRMCMSVYVGVNVWMYVHVHVSVSLCALSMQSCPPTLRRACEPRWRRLDV
jgi:hypothetical protein